MLLWVAWTGGRPNSTKTGSLEMDLPRVIFPKPSPTRPSQPSSGPEFEGEFQFIRKLTGVFLVEEVRRSFVFLYPYFSLDNFELFKFSFSSGNFQCQVVPKVTQSQQATTRRISRPIKTHSHPNQFASEALTLITLKRILRSSFSSRISPVVSIHFVCVGQLDGVGKQSGSKSGRLPDGLGRRVHFQVARQGEGRVQTWKMLGQIARHNVQGRHRNKCTSLVGDVVVCCPALHPARRLGWALCLSLRCTYTRLHTVAVPPLSPRQSLSLAQKHM